jgi:alpha-L-rhamnosidase
MHGKLAPAGRGGFVEAMTTAFRPFKSAVPVWPATLSGQMNIWVSFHARVQLAPDAPAVLRIAAASACRVWWNGAIAGQGPARTAHGHARVDEWSGAADAAGWVRLVIEVADYGVPTFCAVDEPAFLCAELVAGKKAVAWTAPKGGAIVAERRTERVQRVERYSYQRAFCEGYRLGPAGLAWLAPEYQPATALALSRVRAGIRWLDRGVPAPDFSAVHPRRTAMRGRARFSAPRAARITKRRFLFEVPKVSAGYPLAEIEWPLFGTLSGLGFTTTGAVTLRPAAPVALPAKEWLRVDFGAVQTGFPELRIATRAGARVVVLFDEILVEGQIAFDRSDCVNAFWLELAPGAQLDFSAFEPYTFQHLQVLVWEGAAEVSQIRLRSFTTGAAIQAPRVAPTGEIARVRQAAVASFRQNSLDLFMDCPSRERAGWLCDSLFTARAEWHLCGDNPIERAFLENYLRPVTFAGLPHGMVPMCYPAEPLEGCFIPNWAMFFVVQLDEAARLRRLPAEWQPLVERRVRGLLRYFQPFENEAGLLEKLKSWVFVEWSHANDFVQDVNFPTNMLYSATLRAASRLLRDPGLAAKAGRVEQKIRELAWRDGRYVDNAVRDAAGMLAVTENTSEVCQYFAFFTGLARPGDHSALWRRLVRGDYAGMHAANAFVGKLLRLELLIDHGEPAAARRELLKSFAPMARVTGTLWENIDTRASCNHGFTSYVAVLIDRLAAEA